MTQAAPAFTWRPLLPKPGKKDNCGDTMPERMGWGIPLRSAPFVAGGSGARRSGARFQVMLRVNEQGNLGVWLEALAPVGREAERTWAVEASFTMTVCDDGRPEGWEINPQWPDEVIPKKKTILRRASHTFTQQRRGWGWREFGMTRKEFCQCDVWACIRRGHANITVDVRVTNVSAGVKYVGLENQGATCYLNSLLQMFYHLPALRRAVYAIDGDAPAPAAPAAGAAGAGGEIAAPEAASFVPALQSLLVDLQTSGAPRETTELTKAFGWTGADVFKQHDIQELNRVLSDKLGEHMKGMDDAGTIDNLFKGKLRRYTRCLNVECESAVDEDFLDLQVDVKGCSDIQASLAQMLQEETMDGDNQYRTDEHGLQDAVRGAKLVELPKVLLLHLRRFEMDYKTGRINKINDKFTFPVTLQVPVEKDGQQVEEAYRLHTVFVHRGTVDKGHYYVHSNPQCDGEWFRFDDETVFKTSEAQAVDENFGGKGTGNKGRESAYMLTYVQESHVASLLRPVTEQEIPPRLRLPSTEEERNLHQPFETKGFTEVVVNFPTPRSPATADIGDWTRRVRVDRKGGVAHLAAAIERDLGLPAHRQLLWFCAPRKDGTWRPAHPIKICHAVHSMGHGDVTIRQLQLRYTEGVAEMDHFKGKDDAELLHVYVLDTDEGGRPTTGNVLPKNRFAGLVIKYFNGKTLEYVTNANYVESCWIEQIGMNVRERVGAESDGLSFAGTVFEESKGPGDWSLRKLEPCKTVVESDLGHGDVLIICEDAGMTEGRLKKLMPGLTGRPAAGPSSKRQRVK